MSKILFFLRYLLPLIAWLVLIFYLSNQIGSEAVGHDLRGLGPYILRKMFHGSEFAVLALLFYRLLSQIATRWFKPVSKKIFWALLLVAAAAVFDEWHQTLVLGRDGQLADVLFDTGGAALALALLYYLSRYKEIRIFLEGARMKRKKPAAT